MIRFNKWLEKVTEGAARIASWFNVLLILLIGFDVLMRYAFNDTEAWILELEWHFFALVFLLGGAWTYREDRHVRVDVWYTRLRPQRKALINICGTLFLLLPFLYIVIISSWSYASYSYSILEGSADPGGLPGRFVIKFTIPIGFSLLALQAFVNLLKDIALLLNVHPKKNEA